MATPQRLPALFHVAQKVGRSGQQLKILARQRTRPPGQAQGPVDIAPSQPLNRLTAHAEVVTINHRAVRLPEGATAPRTSRRHPQQVSTRLAQPVAGPPRPVSS
jgi:hypothetical protein